MYYYPENLTAKPMLWLWRLKDLAVSGVLALLGVLLATQFQFSVLLLISAAHAFLTIRIEGTSIMDYLRHAALFLLTQQFFLWEDKTIETKNK